MHLKAQAFPERGSQLFLLKVWGRFRGPEGWLAGGAQLLSRILHGPGLPRDSGGERLFCWVHRVKWVKSSYLLDFSRHMTALDLMLTMFQTIWITSGRVVVCVTSQGATGRTCSLSASTAGSGPGLTRRSPRPTPPQPLGNTSRGHQQVRLTSWDHHHVIQTILYQDIWRFPSQTTLRRTSMAAKSHVWGSWTISTRMGSGEWSLSSSLSSSLSLRWHDIACYHPKPYMCEDSDALLEYVAATNEGIELWTKCISFIVNYSVTHIQCSDNS